MSCWHLWWNIFGLLFVSLVASPWLWQWGIVHAVFWLPSNVIALLLVLVVVGFGNEDDGWDHCRGGLDHDYLFSMIEVVRG